MRSSIIGLAVGIGIVFFSMIRTTGNIQFFMDLPSFTIVFGGTISVAILTYGLKTILNMFGMYVAVFRAPKHTPAQIVAELVDISEQIHKNPNILDRLITQGKYHPFINDGLNAINNQFSEEQLNYIMTTMINERKAQFRSEVEALKVISKYPPAFGMIGTVIGLIGVLNQLADMEEVSALGPTMALALITTLFGLFIANYIFNPIADFIAAQSQDDIKIRRIIKAGIQLIHQKHDFFYTKEVLMGYLMPSDRGKVEKYQGKVKRAA